MRIATGRRMRLSHLAICTVLCSQLVAQQMPIQVAPPPFRFPIRSYAPQQVPPIRLANSSRLHDLIRAGKLYLSVEDALGSGHREQPEPGNRALRPGTGQNRARTCQGRRPHSRRAQRHLADIRGG